MHIEKAKQLRRGETVRCPADRGDPAFTGTVTHVGVLGAESHNIHGEVYIWVEVKGPHHKSVWPSNRLN
jgi:hypothetical protein